MMRGAILAYLYLAAGVGVVESEPDFTDLEAKEPEDCTCFKDCNKVDELESVKYHVTCPDRNHTVAMMEEIDAKECCIVTNEDEALFLKECIQESDALTRLNAALTLTAEHSGHHLEACSITKLENYNPDMTPYKKVWDREDIFEQHLIDNNAKWEAAWGYFDYHNFHEITEIYAWIRHLAKKHNFVTATPIGKTAQGQAIIRMTVDPGRKRNQEGRGIMIECGLGSNYWIGPAACIKFASLLMNDKYSVRQPVKFYAWHFVFVANPDGYKYTWEFNRLWDKNRVPTNNGENRCRGVDLKRNADRPRLFGAHCHGGGCSRDPCSSHYSGKREFSERETRALVRAVNDLRGKVSAYVSVRGPGGAVTHPPMDNMGMLPNFNRLNPLSKYMAKVMTNVPTHRRDIEYKYGPGPVHGRRYTGCLTEFLHFHFSQKWAFNVYLGNSNLADVTTGPEEIDDAYRELSSGLLFMASWIGYETAPKAVMELREGFDDMMKVIGDGEVDDGAKIVDK